MDKYLSFLTKVNLFEGINEGQLSILLTCFSAKIVDYSKNDIILLNGNKIKDIGIVLKGQVQVVKEDFFGNRNILANIEKGNIFGEVFVFANSKNTPVTVYSNTESTILFINYNKIISPCEKACGFHNKLIYNMLHILAIKNFELNQKIEYMSKRSIREKLLAYLSSEAQKNGSNKFSISYNRQELADFLSVDRSALSKELSKLRDENFLIFNKNQFKLL